MTRYRLYCLCQPRTTSYPSSGQISPHRGIRLFESSVNVNASDCYTLFVCGQVLVTVREAFAVAPGIRSARVAALRIDARDAYGQPKVSCLLAVRFEREGLAA